jgi:hypothetical protein
MGQLAKGVHVRLVDGYHRTCTSPYAKSLAAELSKCLIGVEDRSTQPVKTGPIHVQGLVALLLLISNEWIDSFLPIARAAPDSIQSSATLNFLPARRECVSSRMGTAFRYAASADIPVSPTAQTTDMRKSSLR